MLYWLILVLQIHTIKISVFRCMQHALRLLVSFLLTSERLVSKWFGLLTLSPTYFRKVRKQMIWVTHSVNDTDKPKYQLAFTSLFVCFSCFCVNLCISPWYIIYMYPMCTVRIMSHTLTNRNSDCQYPACGYLG